MARKTERQKLIQRLVSGGSVHNQDELQSLLENEGVVVTQATLSRDVNELGLVKYRAADGTLCYKLGAEKHENTPSTTIDGIISVEFVSNFVVVKTHPGFASIVASMVDKFCIEQIAGTIAGDDTVFMLMRETMDGEVVMDKLNSLYPGINKKVIVF